MPLLYVANTFQQARRQDSETGEQKQILGGHQNFIYVNLRWYGAREVYSSMDQTKNVKTKKGL